MRRWDVYERPLNGNLTVSSIEPSIPEKRGWDGDMRHTRQALVSYALFEGARRRGKPIQYALLPLILPSIAGKSGESFSSEDLSNNLKQLFGDAFSTYDAESLVPILEVEGYLNREADEDGRAAFTYAESVNSIDIDESIVSAENDVNSIIEEFLTFLDATKPLIKFTFSLEEWKTQFIQWSTSVDTADAKGFQAWIDELVSSEAKPSLKLSGNQEPEERFVGLDRHVIVLFASYVQWLAENKNPLFEKILSLVEIGLVLDLVTAIRQPVKTKAREISLAAVLDGPILLNAQGLSGAGSKEAATALIKLCVKNGIKVITLQHCVDEAREVVKAVLDNPSGERTGLLADAIRIEARLEGAARRFIATPDKIIRDLGVEIVNASQISNFQEKSTFSDDLISEFADRLPYSAFSNQKRKRRDAQSIGFVMRRRGGKTTSDLYNCKYVFVTKSAVLAKFSGRFVSQKVQDYPEYAVPPGIEARHFSTMFLLNFGTDLGESVSRGELLSSCERVLRTSPEMIRKVREAMDQLSLFPPDELEALLNDPVALSEVTAVTGNDPAVVSVENASALAEIIKVSAAKNERINRAKAEKELVDNHGREIRDIEAREQRRISEERARAEKASDQAVAAMAVANAREVEIRKFADLLYEQSVKSAKWKWRLVAIIFTSISSIAVLEIFLDKTSIPIYLRIIIAVCLLLVATYSWASRVARHFSLSSLYDYLLMREVISRMKSAPGEMLVIKLAEISGFQPPNGASKS